MDFKAFAADEKTIDAVERCLQRITEAVIKIDPARMAEISPRTPIDAARGLATCCGMTMTESIWARSGVRLRGACRT